jgi:hypothetical protein
MLISLLGNDMQVKRPLLCIFIVCITLLSACIAPSKSQEPAQTIKLPPAETPAVDSVETSVTIQEGNNLLKTQLQVKRSEELADNRIGDMHSLRADIRTVRAADGLPDNINDIGQKWIRLSVDYMDWPQAEDTGEHSRYYIDPNHDKVVTKLADLNIKIMLCLVFWDEAILSDIKEEVFSRFKSEDEILRWLDYVRFIVRHFKDHIEYYVIWNEPHCPWLPMQNIELPDYINLVRSTVPIIREEYPKAKIVIGTTPGMHHGFGRDYFFGILKSDVMPLVDAISWHPMYGTSPAISDTKMQEMWGGPDYYYNYASLVQEIKDMASSHGFKGEYIAEEIQWRTPGNPNPGNMIYSEIVAAKYYARGIVMHLGMDITVGLSETSHKAELPRMTVMRNLCSVMAGAETASVPVEIKCEAERLRYYGFSLPDGDRLVALWTDGIAVDDDRGVEATIVLPGFTTEKVIGIDVLHGFEQELIFSVEDGSLVISNLLVKDYPVILCLMH